MTVTTDAVIDALVRPTGAIPNGQLPPTPRRKPFFGYHKNSKVEIAQEAINHWRCDSCSHRGWGISQMLDHYDRTSHSRYTRKEDMY